MGKFYNDFNFSVRTRTYEKRVSGKQPLIRKLCLVEAFTDQQNSSDYSVIVDYTSSITTQVILINGKFTKSGKMTI